MAVLFPQQQFFDNNGDPLASGLVYTYITGTNTPKSTWTTAAESANHANPVQLDSQGRAAIWLSTDSEYRIKVYSAGGIATGSQMGATLDNVTGVGIQLSSFSELASDLDVNGYDLISSNNGDIELDPNGTGVIKLTGPATISGTITPSGGWAANTPYMPEAVYLGSLTVASNVIASTTILTGYKRYKIILRHGVAGSAGVSTSSTNTAIQLQLYTNGAYVTSGYTSQTNGFDTGGTAVKANSTSAAGIILIPPDSTPGSSSILSLELNITDVADSIRTVWGHATGVVVNTCDQQISGRITLGAAGALTGFKIMAASGNLSGSQAVVDVFGCPGG